MLTFVGYVFDVFGVGGTLAALLEKQDSLFYIIKS